METRELLLLAATLGSGLVSGLCFAFATFIMQAFDRLGPGAAIRAMQAINAVILRSGAMAVWFGTVLLGVVAAIVAEGDAWVVVSAALYAIGAVLVTGLGNVPLNERLDLIDPEASNSDEAWRLYRVRWGRWNALRTVLCSLACLGFAFAA